MKAALRIAKSDNAASFERPFDEQVRLYYFTFREAVSLLKCADYRLTRLLGKDRYGEVDCNGAWMIPPDQIPHLRRNIWRFL
jgi:hypothetical protein